MLKTFSLSIKRWQTSSCRRPKTAGESTRQRTADTEERQRREIEQQGAELARLAALLDAERQAAHRAGERAEKAEAERDGARQAESAAREESARWRGQAEALQGQQGEFMRALGTAEPKTAAPKARKPKAETPDGHG